MLTLSKSNGISGVIKESPEDFVVKEITEKGMVLEPGRKYTPEELGQTASADGKFTVIVLQKTKWDTSYALVTLAKRLSRGRKSIGYAGSKDRMSVSVQLASIFGTKPEQFSAFKIKDLSINGAWQSDSGVELGSNVGNAFEVTIRKISSRKPQEAALNVLAELDGMMPNYFDRQRFGIRLNNASIGVKIMRGETKEAVMDLLTNTYGEENKEATEARKRLAEEQDFKKAQEYFPGYLRVERTVINHLAEYDNYTNAVRALPRGIAIMFIHSVESLLFNMAVEKRIKRRDFDSIASCGMNFYGFPDVSRVEPDGTYPLEALVGYKTDDRMISSYIGEAMEKIGISKEQFKINGIPELSMAGNFRPILSPVTGIKCDAVSPKSLKISFSVPSGSYATVLLNEIMKNQDFDTKQILAASSAWSSPP